MTTTNFVNGITLTDDDWFNDVDAITYEGTFPSGPSTVVVTGATTLAVFNTVATTINAFGAASVALNIGHASAAAAFPGGISIPTGKTLAGAGAVAVTGSITGASKIYTGTGYVGQSVNNGATLSITTANGGSYLVAAVSTDQGISIMAVVQSRAGTEVLTLLTTATGGTLAMGGTGNVDIIFTNTSGSTATVNFSAIKLT